MNSKGKTLRVRERLLERHKQGFLGFIRAAAVFGYLFPFTMEVPFSLSWGLMYTE